jgi:hypothetical protein
MNCQDLTYNYVGTGRGRVVDMNVIAYLDILDC